MSRCHGAAAIVAALAAASMGGCGGGVGTGGSSSTTSPTTATPASYTLGGNIGGLTSQGLTLNNGADALSIAAGATSFTFDTSIATGTAYAVTVQLQPSGLTCTVANGSGTMGTANITDVEVTCAGTSFTIGGTITGLTAAGLILSNGTDIVKPAAGATTFTFPTAVPTAVAYDVVVTTQPSGQTCQVTNGTGVVLTSSVNNVAVSCM